MSSNEDPSLDDTDPKSEAVSDFGSRDDVAWRLTLLVGHRPVSEAARDWGLKDATLRQYLKGSMPSLEKATQIAEAERVHIQWIATGEGPRDIQPEGALSHVGTDGEHGMQSLVQARGVAEQLTGLRMLPQLSVEASAGPGLIPMGEHVEGFVALNEQYLREIGVNPRFAHVLRVAGRSMAPTINDKDVVVVDTSVRAPVSEGIYTLVYGDTVLLKRIRLQRDGGLVLVSDNKSEGYADEAVPRSELATLSIVGRVKGHIRSL